jgi:hypothetical protein
MNTSVRNGRVGGWTRALLSAATVLAFLAAAMVGCGGGGGGSGGNLTTSGSEAWVMCEEGECYGVSFRSGGKLFLVIGDGNQWMTMEMGTWSTNGSRLNITICGQTESGEYSVSGNTLRLIDEDGDGIFTKRTGLKPEDMGPMLAQMGMDYCDAMEGGFLKSHAKKLAKSLQSKITQ